MIKLQFQFVDPLFAALRAQKTNGVNNLPPMPMPPRSAPVVATVTIQKHGHTIIRATDNKVWLDGNRVN